MAAICRVTVEASSPSVAASAPIVAGADVLQRHEQQVAGAPGPHAPVEVAASPEALEVTHEHREFALERGNRSSSGALLFPLALPCS